MTQMGGSADDNVGGAVSISQTPSPISTSTVRISAHHVEDIPRRTACTRPAVRCAPGGGWTFPRHVQQADAAWDFDFLRTGFGTAVPELAIFSPGMSLKPETRDALTRVSTATLATALYECGLRNQMVQDVRPLGPPAQSMVGEAFTLRYMRAREVLNELSVFRDRGHPQRRAAEKCPRGTVMEIDNRGDPRAASAGGILVTRLMVRGAAGVVTDGGFCDFAEISKLVIPAFHKRPSAPTNLTRHQAIDINVPSAALTPRSTLRHQCACLASTQAATWNWPWHMECHSRRPPSATRDACARKLGVDADCLA